VKTRKVLVVDDDAIVLESCRKILESEGYKATCAQSAREAIDILEMSYFDLMVMDIKMPEHDGIYLLGKVREKWPMDRWPELPVLVMTGFPTPETLKALRRSGARSFIAKPFTPDELAAAARKLLKRSESNETDESSGDR
jgi:DNA-binding response OmpR family regulator